MALSSLENIHKQAQRRNLEKGRKKVDAKRVAEMPMLDDEEEEKPKFPGNTKKDGMQIVRTPRLEVAPKVKKRAAEMSASSLLTPTDSLGVKKHTQERRELIIAWLLNGHMYDGRLMSATELADTLSVPMETLERDLSTIKQQFSDLYTDPTTTDKELPAYAYMLLEMKMQDRGRALTLYNEIAEDIKAMKEGATIMDNAMGRGQRKGLALSGRDLAAMRNAQLTALDVASKATAGLDALFKMLGGPEKVQNIIKAKTVQVNNAGGNQMGQFATLEVIQDTIGQMPEFRGVLPSTRLRDKLPTPAFLELTDEDKAIMQVGEDARRGK